MPPNTSSHKGTFVLFTNRSFLDEDDRPSKIRTPAALSTSASTNVDVREQHQQTSCSASCSPERYATITTGAFKGDMAIRKMCGECNVHLASTASWFCALDCLFCSNNCRSRFVDAVDAEDAVASPGTDQTKKTIQLNLSQKALHRSACID